MEKINLNNIEGRIIRGAIEISNSRFYIYDHMLQDHNKKVKNSEWTWHKDCIETKDNIEG